MYYSKPFRTTRNMENFHRMPWYRIENKDTGPSSVLIYDEIGLLGVSAQDFLRDVSAIDGDIDVHINTPGGEVFDGLAIFNYLSNRAGNVTVYVDSLAASIGSVIAMAGKPVIMAKNSSMMIHDGFAMAIGNAADMRQTADLLDKTSDNIASIYAERTGTPATYWREQMRTETWFSAQEAVNAGLADQVGGRKAETPSPSLSPAVNKASKKVRNAKYNTDDRNRMAKAGQAMPDGSYPIADSEDLDNAIHAVGRGGADHNSIRQHIIKRAAALGLSSRIPGNWNSDGSLKSSNKTDFELLAQTLTEVFK